MEILADPYAELPLRNDKYAKLCNELHLGSRNITKLTIDFMKFPNLIILWLNNNHLTNLDLLSHNIRLKYLYLHYNHLQTLTNIFHHLLFLEYLTLNNNQLSSLTDVITQLKVLKHLKYLDLFNNPITQEDSYRLHILSELPWLQSLDRIPVTKNEIKEAKKFKIKLKKLNNIQLSSGGLTPSTAAATTTAAHGDSHSHSDRHGDDDNSNRNDPCHSPRANSLNLLLFRIKQLFTQKRIFFKDICLQYDRRRLGLMTPSDFKSCLIQFNILSQLTEEEYQQILNKYIVPTPIPAITLTDLTMSHINQSSKKKKNMTDNGSRTMSVMKNMRLVDDLVNYDLFCQDTLPQSLHHTKKPLGTSTTMTITNEKVPEISRTVRDLISSVQKYETDVKQQEEKKKRDTILNASSSTDANFTFYNTASNTLQGTGVIGGAMMGGLSSGSPRDGLDPWFIGQLRTILTEISWKILSSSGTTNASGGNKKPSLSALCKQTTPEIQFTSLHLQEVFSRMASLGKTLKYPNSSEELISHLLKNKSTISLQDLVHLLQLDSSSAGGTVGAPILPSSPSTSQRKKLLFHSSSMKIEWRDLTEKERRDFEKREFQDAQDYLQQILRPSAAGSGSGGKESGSQQNPNQKEDLLQLTFQKSINGTRMRATSRSTSCWGSEDGGRSGSQDDPYRVIQSAPNRADVIVIPSLKSAAQRQQQVEDLERENNWTEHFQKFGLKNEGLELALKRKQRSLLGNSSSSLSSVTPSGVAVPLSSSISLSSSMGATRTSQKKADKEKKGWNNTTGTIVLK